MPQSVPTDIDRSSPPFDRLTTVQWLAPDRSGRESFDNARHQLYVGRDKRTSAHVLIKLTTKPGLVYQQDLVNEIATLSTINRELPASRYFPELHDHGSLRDGRVYLVISLFDEFPLATTIGPERMPGRLVTQVRIAIEVARALTELHGLGIFHVDLNPMNILHRAEKGTPVIRIVDFESSYETARHAAGEFYNPPTTPSYCAPEVSREPPDARADLFSLGAVLYTMVTGFQTGELSVSARIDADRELDPDLRGSLLKATDPDRRRRHAAVDPFRRELESYLERIWPGRSW